MCEQKKKFQQIYLEITNICNLSCPFCRNDSRSKQFMSLEKVKKYIDDCAKFTDSFYLHVKGEPLLHPDFKEIMAYLALKEIKTKITTNGTLLDKMGDEILKHQNIKHINISLQSFVYLSAKEQEAYLINLKAFLNKITHQYVYLRNWIDNASLNDKIKEMFEIDSLSNNQNLKEHVIYSTQSEFTWPNDEKTHKSKGPCLGGKKQLAILVNGDVVLCCLDDEAKTKIGNLNCESLDTILKSDLYRLSTTQMPYFDLCQKCGFRIRFIKEDV